MNLHGGFMSEDSTWCPSFILIVHWLEFSHMTRLNCREGLEMLSSLMYDKKKKHFHTSPLPKDQSKDNYQNFLMYSFDFM